MTRVIDVHAHLLPRSAIAAVQAGEDWFGSTIETDELGRPVIVTGEYQAGLGAKEHFDSMEHRIQRMDELGIDMQVLSMNAILYRYGLNQADAVAAANGVNDEFAGYLRQWPDRFACFGMLPMQDPEASVRELERVMQMPGMVGATVGTHVNNANWDEPHLFPVLEAAADLGAMIFFHPAASRLETALTRFHMRNFIANPTETTIAIGSLIFGGVLDRLPKLKTLFAHGGGYACWGSGRFDHGYSVREEARQHAALVPSEYLDRLWYDSLVHNHGNLRQLIETVGSDRIMLGTDFPADMGQPEPLQWIKAAGLADDDEQKILGGNASMVLGLSQ